MNSIDDKFVDSTPTLQDTMGDDAVVSQSLPGYPAWCEYADGNIDEAELDAAWVAEQEAQDQLLLDELRGVTDDELIEISQGRDRSDERLRAAVVHELGRRLAEKCGQARKSA
jgi:hypothetical protein